MSADMLSCESLSCLRADWNQRGRSRIVDISARFAAGQFHAVCGPDGCGKGLLLNILGLLEPPDSGRIELAGVDTTRLDEEERCQIRNEAYGFIFNHPCLLPSFSVAENVAMPLFRICGGEARQARTRTLEVLDFCGIAALEDALSGRLPPPARIRAAFARALAHRPRILIAVSPPGGSELAVLGVRAARELGLCVIWAGDEDVLSPLADRVMRLENGRIVDDCPA